MEILAKTLFGLEPLLADEITRLGGKNIRMLKRAVRFEGDKELLYKSNYHLRTALRILLPISRFSAGNDQELYDHIRQIPWGEYLDAGSTLHVDSVVFSDIFTHSKYVSLRVKDAIVDQFMEKLNRRPSVSHEEADLRINMHINQQLCTLSLDSSGESLHKRGYRIKESVAPLNEVLAAGMILISGWRGEQALMDPMCGSGTLLIEAAMIALDLPPGFTGRSYSFQRWKDYDPELFGKINAYGSNRPVKRPEIIGSDVSGQAVLACLSNMAAARLKDSITVSRKDFFALEPASSNVLVIMNPPYGERIGKEDINDFYRRIGDRLKSHFTGHEAWVLSSNKEAMKHFGLRPAKRMVLYNGPLECHYSAFRLYRGSMKAKYRKEAT